MSSLDLLLGTSEPEGASTQQVSSEKNDFDFFSGGQSMSFSNALDLILNDGVSEPAPQSSQQAAAAAAAATKDEHLNNENFFDFFETVQQQQQQQQPQQPSQFQSIQLIDIEESPEKCDIEQLKESLNLLKSVSHKHNRILTEEEKLEDCAQETILNAWKLTTISKQFKFYCKSCDKYLQHTHQYKKTKFSVETLNKAIDFLNRCLSLLTRGVYLSMYEQTLSEVTTAHNIQLYITTEQNSEAHLKQAIDTLHSLLYESTENPEVQSLSVSTVTFLRRSFITLARLLQKLNPSEDTNKYLQSRLSKVSEGFSWGACLFNFEGFVDQIVRNDWLNTTFGEITSGVDDESQFLHLFSRIPWTDISKYNEGEVRAFVLGSLAKFIAKALEKRFSKLAVMCAEVATFACNLYPEMTKKVFSMLTDSSLPDLKIVLSSVFPFLPFNFDIDKYYTLQGQSKNVIRNGFGTFLFNNFDCINSIKEQRPAALSRIKDKHFLIGSFYNKIYGYLNFFPHFLVLTEIAFASFKHKNIIKPYNNNSLDLINTTIDELCYFAFVFNVGTTSQTRQILDHIKSDAFKNLVILVNEYPALFYRIVSNIGIYASDINATYATCFIDSCRSIIQNLVPDTNMGVCLGTLLAHTTVPPYVCELPSVSSTQAAYEYAKRVFLMEPPSRQMTRSASFAAASVGAKLLETLNWDLAGASLKAQLMFMIVSARKFVSEQWFVKLLTRKSTVFVPPFDISFVKTLLELKPHQFVNQCDIILVQTKVLLSLVKDHYFSADGSGRRSRFDARWFAKSGFYECLEFLYRKDNRDAALAFAAASWDVLTAEQSTLIRKMDGVLALVQDDTKALTRFVGATIRNSGTGAPLYKTISAWISLLGPKASASPSCMHVLDSIYHYAFLHTLPLFSAPKLFHLLGAPQNPVPMAGRHPIIWIALACALDAKTRGTGSSQGTRECLDRLCSVAAAAVRNCVGESPAKMAPLWDRFFRVFCEQKDGGAWLSTELRFALREHFAHAVKSTKPPLSEYYGMLANWDRDQRAAVEKKYADEVLPFIQKKKVSPLEEAVAGEDDGEGDAAADDSVEEANKFLLKSNLKPFLVMDLEKRRELFVMYNFIPAEAEKGAQKKESDMARRFDNDIKSTVKDIMCGDGGSRLDQIVACTQLPVMKRLFECLETYTAEMGALSELNREYAHATATMYTTNEQERTFKMVCTCKRANVFKAPDSEVAAGPGSESIGPNRSAYNKSMHKFLGSSKAIGYVVALLQLVVAKYLNNAPDKLVNMFFALVPLVIHKNLPPKSPIAADIVGILEDIAARTRMDASPELQSLLFGVLMDIGKATSYAAYTPTPHYKSVSDPHAPSAASSPQQHQPVGTEESTRAIIDLYNPACYLKAGDAAARPTYVSQIDEIGRSATLGDSERELLYQRFGSTFDDAAFRVVVEDAAVLSEMLALLRRLTSAEAPLVGLFVGFCSRLIQHDFTRFAPVVADVLISSSDENAGAAQVGLDILRGAFAAVDSARLSLAQVAQVVRVLTHKLPLKPAPRLAVLAIASQLFVSGVWLSDFERRSTEKAGTSMSASMSMSTSTSTSEEMIPSLIDVGVDTSIDTLKLFTSFVKAFLGCCRTARADGPSVEKFAALVKDLAAALIARNSSNNNMAVVALMNVVYTLVVPKLIAMKMSNSPLIADIFSAFPPAYVTGSWRFWNKSTVDYMAAVIFGSNAEAADLYTKLAKDVDWASFLAYVHDRAAEEKRKRAEEKEEEDEEEDDGSVDNRKTTNSSLLLSIFRFFILFRMINPDVFGRELWDTLTPASIARPDAAVPGFDWSVLESSEFAALFGGSFFAELLKECAANMAGAPVGPFEAMLWIAEVAKTLRFDAVVAASREARALAFLAVENAATHTFWLLSSNDADRILLEIELSFCTYLAGFSAGTCDEEFGEVVRNTLSFCAPQNMRILSGTASFAKQTLENSKTHEPSVAEEVQRRTKKYSAIVFQFPKQSSQKIALEFIAQTFSAFGKDVQLSIAFMEEAVRAYLLTASSADTAAEEDGDGENGVDDNDSKMNSLGKRMSLPPVPLEAFLQECANSDASLCVYALCERFRYIGKMEKYLNSVAQLISKFSPHKIYQYDVVAVWMAPINALASEGWTPTANELLKLTQIAKFLRDFATDIININGFILGASGYESTFTRLRFIALSCSIFYLKLILRKEEDDDDDDEDGVKSGYGDDVTTAPLLSKAEEDHVDALNQLVKLKASNDTPDLKAFFKITKKFNDSSYTASSFKRDVTRTLCPMAPYLQNL